MGKFKGTSGEWYKMKADQMGVPFIVASGNETLFQVYGEDAEHNANIALAAPEILEALEELIGFCEFHGYNNSTEINKARLVLKKATE